MSVGSMHSVGPLPAKAIAEFVLQGSAPTETVIPSSVSDFPVSADPAILLHEEPQYSDPAIDRKLDGGSEVLAVLSDSITETGKSSVDLSLSDVLFTDFTLELKKEICQVVRDRYLRLQDYSPREQKELIRFAQYCFYENQKKLRGEPLSSWISDELDHLTQKELSVSRSRLKAIFEDEALYSRHHVSFDSMKTIVEENLPRLYKAAVIDCMFDKENGFDRVTMSRLKKFSRSWPIFLLDSVFGLPGAAGIAGLLAIGGIYNSGLGTSESPSSQKPTTVATAPAPEQTQAPAVALATETRPSDKPGTKPKEEPEPTRAVAESLAKPVIETTTAPISNLIKVNKQTASSLNYTVTASQGDSEAMELLEHLHTYLNIFTALNYDPKITYKDGAIKPSQDFLDKITFTYIGNDGLDQAMVERTLNIKIKSFVQHGGRKYIYIAKDDAGKLFVIITKAGLEDIREADQAAKETKLPANFDPYESFLPLFGSLLVRPESPAYQP